MTNARPKPMTHPTAVVLLLPFLFWVHLYEGQASGGERKDETRLSRSHLLLGQANQFEEPQESDSEEEAEEGGVAAGDALGLQDEERELSPADALQLKEALVTKNLKLLVWVFKQVSSSPHKLTKATRDYVIGVNGLILRDKKQATALHLAAAKGYLKVVSALVAQGALVRCLDQDHASALIYAVRAGKTQVAQQLLATEMVAWVDRDGRNALHWAVEKQNLEMVQLISQQAPHLQDMHDSLEGQTPRECALQMGWSEGVEELSRTTWSKALLSARRLLDQMCQRRPVEDPHQGSSTAPP